jgi:hypothetical protein
MASGKVSGLRQLWERQFWFTHPRCVRRLCNFAQLSIHARMNALRRKPGLAGFRSRWLALFCIALTLTFGASAAVSASESAHHEVEVAQAASPATTIICLGNDRSCGLPDHDEDDVVPHLHTVDIGSVGVIAVQAPATVRQSKAESVPLPASLSVEGLKQPTPERPPRTTCI